LGVSSEALSPSCRTKRDRSPFLTYALSANVFVVTAAFAALLMASSPQPAGAIDCFRTEIHNGVELRVYLGDRHCIDFNEPREMRGIWLNEFEGSAFIEGAESVEDALPKWKNRWFTIDASTERPKAFQPRRGHAYRLKVVAREVWKDDPPPLGGYGHLGVWPGLILADRITEWEDLGPIMRGSADR
jgi:hypothetical protein